MAIIVENKESKRKFVLISANFEYSKEIASNRFISFLRDTEEKEFEVICLCDENGEIFFSNASEFRIIEVDGKLLNQIL